MTSHSRTLAGPLAVAGLLLVWSPTGLMQQSQTPTGPAGQPGIRWSEEQLKQAVAPVPVGRKLTPKSGPNGAKVVVCLSYDIDNVALPTPTSQQVFGAVLDCLAFSICWVATRFRRRRQHELDIIPRPHSRRPPTTDSMRSASCPLET